MAHSTTCNQVFPGILKLSSQRLESENENMIESHNATITRPLSNEEIRREVARQISQARDVEEIRICDVRAGDTVFHDGKVRTVCIKDIKKDSFMGWMLFGDSYVGGLKPVHRIIMRNGLQ